MAGWTGVLDLARAGVLHMGRADVLDVARADVLDVARAGAVDMGRASALDMAPASARPGRTPVWHVALAATAGEMAGTVGRACQDRCRSRAGPGRAEVR
jgi:uncharacterized protein (UPF0261 family)